MNKYRPIIIFSSLILAVVIICFAITIYYAPSKSAYKQFVDDTNTLITSLRSDVTDLQGIVTFNGDRITAVETAIAVLQTTVQTSIDNKIGAYSSSLDNVLNQINSISQQISGYSQQVNSLSNSISNYNDRINTLAIVVDSKLNATEINTLKELINDDMVLIGELQNKISVMQATVNSLTQEIRGYSIQGLVKLLGANDYASTLSYGSNHLMFARFQCTVSGTLTLIRFRATTYGGIKVAIYSDNASKPYELLSSNAYDTIVSEGWATVPISAVNLVAGQYYWFAYNTATNCAGWTNAQVGMIYYSNNPVAYSNLVFPPIADMTAYTLSTMLCLISGWTN
jgi:archaellum component FlaC